MRVCELADVPDPAVFDEILEPTCELFGDGVVVEVPGDAVRDECVDSELDRDGIFLFLRFRASFDLALEFLGAFP